MYIRAAPFNQLSQIPEIFHLVQTAGVLDSHWTLVILFFFIDSAAVNTVMAI